MADHLDAPGLTSPDGDARIDITDVYAFQKPGDATKSIVILNVNPLAPTLANEFRPHAVYRLNVDTEGDAVAEIAFSIVFTPVDDGTQTATVHRVTGAQAARPGATGEVIIEDAPVSFGSTPIVTESGPYKFFAGPRSDPFFFDLLGFLNDFHFTGSDFFIDKNVFGPAPDDAREGSRRWRKEAPPDAEREASSARRLPALLPLPNDLTESVGSLSAGEGAVEARVGECAVGDWATFTGGETREGGAVGVTRAILARQEMARAEAAVGQRDDVARWETAAIRASWPAIARYAVEFETAIGCKCGCADAGQDGSSPRDRRPRPDALEHPSTGDRFAVRDLLLTAHGILPLCPV